MTPEQFCYWLKGYCELNGEVPTKEQWESVLDHLNLVFNKVTPDRMPEKMESPELPEMEIPQEVIDKLVEKLRNNPPTIYPPAAPYNPAPWEGPIC